MKKITGARGITLPEFLIAIAFIVVIAVIAVTFYFSVQDTGEANLCAYNRENLERKFDIQYVLDRDLTLEEFLTWSVTTDLVNICPKGGRYSVSTDGAHVVCAAHNPK